MPLVAAAALLVTLVMGTAAWSTAVEGVSIKNFGRVNDNYFRGSQPDPAQMAELGRMGVKTVIDVRNDRKKEAASWAETAGLKYFHIPLSTKKPATDEQIAYFLKLVDDPANWPVYVHCKGGRRR